MHNRLLPETAPMPDAVMVNWTKKFVRTNHWRVAQYYDRDDFLQECHKVYTRCFWRYGHLPGPVFMGRYMKAVANHTHDLSRQTSQYRKMFTVEADLDHDNGGDLSPLERLQEAEQTGDLQGILLVIAEAPNAQVRQLLAEFMGHKSILLAPGIHQRVRKKEETTAEFICRLLGIDVDAARTLVRQCKEYLHGSVSAA